MRDYFPSTYLNVENVEVHRRGAEDAEGALRKDKYRFEI
jgi:hypothetical protein